MVVFSTGSRPYVDNNSNNQIIDYQPPTGKEVAWVMRDGGLSRLSPGQKARPLMQRLVLTYCPPGGRVFDPTVGTGTTAIVCVLHERRYTIFACAVC